jgi:hypothetical protein
MYSHMEEALSTTPLHSPTTVLASRGKRENRAAVLLKPLPEMRKPLGVSSTSVHVRASVLSTETGRSCWCSSGVIGAVAIAAAAAAEYSPVGTVARGNVVGLLGAVPAMIGGSAFSQNRARR